MRAMFLIYRDPDAYQPLDEAGYAAVVERYERFAEKHRAAGRLAASQRLPEPEKARSLRRRKDSVLVTDGPFVETKELLAGFFIVDCADMDEAVEFSKELPAVETGCVEIRPLMDVSQFLSA